MTNELTARLAMLAAQQTTLSYGALARALGWRMGELTAALEALMEADAALGLPLRAVLVTARLSPEMPAAGFFLKAQELGVFDGQDPVAFVQDQREKLFRLKD
jgi:chromosome segregation and condensation protein ScpB